MKIWVLLFFLAGMASTAWAQEARVPDASPQNAAGASAAKSPWAVDVFLHADHFQKSSKLNEENYGLGLKYYVSDKIFNSGGEFFGEVGGLRNSQKGEAYFLGGGYTKKIFEVRGVRVSGSIAPMYVDYGARGKSARATAVLPFVSIGYGRWDTNVVYFSKHDGGFLLLSLQYRF